MKRPFLSRLQTNGVYYIIGAILLVVVAPLYQVFVLVPQGYNEALAAAGKGLVAAYLAWVKSHAGFFVGYRLALVIAFACIFSFSFTLFRIIVAQEILGGEVGPDEKEDEDGVETPEEEGAEDERGKSADTLQKSGEDDDKEVGAGDEQETMPAYAWRGKGYALIAAWAGLFGIISFLLGTLAGSVYTVGSAFAYTSSTGVPGGFAGLSGAFTIMTYTVGGGLLAVACLFFGAVIASKGRNLWPGIWVVFAYMALALAALFSGSAVAVSGSPAQAQSALTTLALLGFGLWILWFGVMLARLKPE